MANKKAKKGAARKKGAAKRRPATAFCGSCGDHLLLPASNRRAAVKSSHPVLRRAHVAAAAAAAAVANRTIIITATPNNAASFVVNLDGQQVGGLVPGQPASRPIAPGSHLLTAIVFGNPGASLSVSGTVAGQAGVNTQCSVDPAGNPGAAAAPFTVV